MDGLVENWVEKSSASIPCLVVVDQLDGRQNYKLYFSGSTVFFRPFLIFFIELVELSVDRLVNLAHSFFYYAYT